MDENRRCGFLREGECGLLCGAGDNPRVYYKGGKRVRVRVCVYIAWEDGLPSGI